MTIAFGWLYKLFCYSITHLFVDATNWQAGAENIVPGEKEKKKKGKSQSDKKKETELWKVKGRFLWMDKEGEKVCGSERAKCFVASGVCAAERDSLMEGPCEECWQSICFNPVSSSPYKHCEQVHCKIRTGWGWGGVVVLANEYLLIKGKYTYLMRTVVVSSSPPAGAPA